MGILEVVVGIFGFFETKLGGPRVTLAVSSDKNRHRAFEQVERQRKFENDIVVLRQRRNVDLKLNLPDRIAAQRIDGLCNLRQFFLGALQDLCLSQKLSLCFVQEHGVFHKLFSMDSS